MIEVTMKTTKLEGTKEQIKAEFCCLVNQLITKHEDAGEPILTREELDECIEMATMSEDELHQKTLDALAEIFDMLGKFL